MKIHTNHHGLPAASLAVYALQEAKDAGKVASHVHLDICTPQASRSHSSGAVVHLATLQGGRGTTHPHRTNSGRYGAASSDYDGWAARYEEWGWFLAYLFRADPTAKTTGQYSSESAFHAATQNKFRLTPALSA